MENCQSAGEQNKAVGECTPGTYPKHMYYLGYFLACVHIEKMGARG